MKADTKARAPFLRAHPPTALYGLPERPKFAEGGGSEEVAWFVWSQEGFEDDVQRIRMLERRT